MFQGEKDARSKATKAVKSLHGHVVHKSHDRHIHLKECRDRGLKIIALEDDHQLQDIVLTVHHAYMHTFSGTSAIKIIENHNGVAMVHHIATVPAR
jgi:hypothetical protein